MPQNHKGRAQIGEQVETDNSANHHCRQRLFVNSVSAAPICAFFGGGGVGKVHLPGSPLSAPVYPAAGDGCSGSPACVGWGAACVGGLFFRRQAAGAGRTVCSQSALLLRAGAGDDLLRLFEY